MAQCFLFLTVSIELESRRRRYFKAIFFFREFLTTHINTLHNQRWILYFELPSLLETAILLKFIRNCSIVLYPYLFDEGKATGRRASAWVRSWAQGRLFRLGASLHAHAGKVIFVAALLIATFAVGLKSATSETRVHKLWVEGSKFSEKAA
ncbi:hypothetical protein J437_LFUL004496 [Ladona fulva]|uniref:Uncharacterized protein n=1 Tax=Ladona fulva TaxID=123851 RepID=A0A8K0P321_LADFU|nr:hypothetical protein J437_LFUL004496 [Ladona fulva]